MQSKMKLNLMQRIATLVSLGLFFGIFQLYAREMGDFVTDIKVPPFEFKLPKIEKRTVAPGLFLHSLENPELPIVYGEIHIYAGKKDVGEEPIEVARLLEDTWEFSGSKPFPKEKFLTFFEDRGATFSLSIEYEKSIIAFSYLKEKESEIYPILESFWKEPNLDPEILETMRSKIKEELSRRNDNPNSIGSRKSKEVLFGGTILGTSPQISRLEKLKIENIQRFLTKILGAEKKVLLLSGDSNASIWNEKFPEWQKNPKIDSTSPTKERITSLSIKDRLKKLKSQTLLVEREATQAFLLQVGTLPEHNHPDFYALQLLNYIIGGGGFNSYYMREIRNNRGLAYSAGSGADFQENYGIIQFYSMTKVSTVREVLDLMKEFNNPKFIKTIQEAELERAKNAINNQFVFLFTDTRRILQNDLRFTEHKMPPNYLENFQSNITKVTLSDLKRVGETYFRPEEMRTIIVGPKELQKQLGNGVLLIQPEDLIPE